MLVAAIRKARFRYSTKGMRPGQWPAGRCASLSHAWAAAAAWSELRGRQDACAFDHADFERRMVLATTRIASRPCVSDGIALIARAAVTHAAQLSQAGRSPLPRLKHHAVRRTRAVAVLHLYIDEKNWVDPRAPPPAIVNGDGSSMRWRWLTATAPGAAVNTLGPFCAPFQPQIPPINGNQRTFQRGPYGVDPI